MNDFQYTNFANWTHFANKNSELLHSFCLLLLFRVLQHNNLKALQKLNFSLNERLLNLTEKLLRLILQLALCDRADAFLNFPSHHLPAPTPLYLGLNAHFLNIFHAVGLVPHLRISRSKMLQTILLDLLKSNWNCMINDMNHLWLIFFSTEK